VSEKFLRSLDKYQRAYGVLFALLCLGFMFGSVMNIQRQRFIQAFMDIVSSFIWMFDAYLFLRKRKIVPAGTLDNEKPPDK